MSGTANNTMIHFSSTAIRGIVISFIPIWLNGRFCLFTQNEDNVVIKLGVDWSTCSVNF